MDHDTLPPDSADDAALEYGRQLGELEDRTADWWACIKRTARQAGLGDTPHDLDSNVHG